MPDTISNFLWQPLKPSLYGLGLYLRVMGDNLKIIASLQHLNEVVNVEKGVVRHLPHPIQGLVAHRCI